MGEERTQVPGTGGTIPNPAASKKTPSRGMGDFTISNPVDKTGGLVGEDGVDFTTNQRLLSLNASVTGLAELALGSPGILSNKIAIAPLIGIQYTILDVGVGPRFGMQQDFHLDPDARVRLEFDKAVILEDLFNDQEIETMVVDFALGDSVNLRFDNEVGKLVRREYYAGAPQFTNKTGLTIDPGMKVEIGCIELLDFGGCAIREDFATTGLANINVFDETWTLGGFNSVAFLGDQGTGEGGDGEGGETPVSEPPVAVLFGSVLIMLAFLTGSRQRADSGSRRRSAEREPAGWLATAA